MMGDNLFETVKPELIKIGERTTISTRCIILTHYVHQNLEPRKWTYPPVNFGEDVRQNSKNIVEL